MTTTQPPQPPTIHYPEDGSVQPVARFLWHPIPAPILPDEPSPHLIGKKIALVGGSRTTIHQIARALEENGAHIYHFLPATHNYELAAQTFVQQAQSLDGIIDLNLDTPFTLENMHAWEDAFSQTIALLKAVYQDWAEETDSQRLFYIAVTTIDGQMGYNTGTSFQQPLGGLWAGLAKTLHREIPNCNVKIIDYAPRKRAEAGLSPTQIESLLKELYHWGLFEIGYHNGIRYTLTAQKEEVPHPVHTLGASDHILISGGGRGIGFALAKALAENFGCHITVTGRHTLPNHNEAWLHLSEHEFKTYQQQQLHSIPKGQSIRTVLNRLEQQKHLRQLHQNIEHARTQGLPIHYEVCDFTSLQQVQALLARVGPTLTGVIHNAGIDTPTRLPTKPLATFIRTIQTKIYGFLHLIEALGNKQLTFFCNVGSLTGRLGGMVGQLDYAAANEGLTRLGLWVEHTLAPPFPIKTLCWPTWNQLGMIANFEATLRYMTAMHVEEGLYHWQRELLAPSSGEITFIGPIGQALSPLQARGYPHIPNLPGIEHIYPRTFYLGEIEHYQPTHSLTSTYTLDTRLAPFLADFQIDNIYALPISMLLEIIVHTGAWLTPPTGPAQHLQEIRNLTINLPALKTHGIHYQLKKQATLSQTQPHWTVKVALTRQIGPNHQTLAQAELIYDHNHISDSHKHAGSAETSPAVGDGGAVMRGGGLCAVPVRPLPSSPSQPHLNDIAPAPPSQNETTPEIAIHPNPHLTWKGIAFKPSHWHQNSQGQLTTQTIPCHANDLWSIPYPPEPHLPLTAIENILHLTYSRQNTATQPQKLHIASISRRGAPLWPPATTIVGDDQENVWHIVREGLNRTEHILKGILYT